MFIRPLPRFGYVALQLSSVQSEKTQLTYA